MCCLHSRGESSFTRPFTYINDPPHAHPIFMCQCKMCDRSSVDLLRRCWCPRRRPTHHFEVLQISVRVFQPSLVCHCIIFIHNIRLFMCSYVSQSSPLCPSSRHRIHPYNNILLNWFFISSHFLLLSLILLLISSIYLHELYPPPMRPSTLGGGATT